jgi:hypothetical protein
MKILHTDASFDWNHTNSTEESIVRGKIAVWEIIAQEGMAGGHIEKVAIGKVKGLKQYINILELTAIARAIEIASLETLKDDAIEIFTDSKTALAWATKGKIKPSVLTLAHQNALEYLSRARLQFGGSVTIKFIPREQNFAGKMLEQELEQGKKPHDL